MFYDTLLRAPQMPIIVDDVASALLVIIQIRVARIAAVGRALGFKIIAAHTHVLAALRIGAERSVAESASGNPRHHATQCAILVQDLSMAFPVIVDARVLV